MKVRLYRGDLWDRGPVRLKDALRAHLRRRGMRFRPDGKLEHPVTITHVPDGPEGEYWEYDQPGPPQIDLDPEEWRRLP